jgi:hypothetical protein
MAMEQEQATIKDLVQEVRALERKVDDIIENTRRQANHDLEKDYGGGYGSEKLLRSYQEMGTLWAEALARSAWLLEQYSPTSLFRQVAKQLGTLEMSSGSPR